MTLEQIEKALKDNGFSELSELLGAYQKAMAEKTKAEEARDKFSNDLKATQETLRTKAGEIGALKQEVEQLKAAVPAHPSNPPTQLHQGKKPEDELAEVEKALTEEQWAEADAVLAGMKKLVEEGKMNAEEVSRIDTDTATRLAFLKGLAKEGAGKALPTSFRRTVAASPAPTPESLYQTIKKRITGVAPSPMGPARRGSARGAAEKQSNVSWLRQ
jgi:polyhydroxyalkanoate synthesis regulator phasin